MKKIFGIWFMTDKEKRRNDRQIYRYVGRCVRYEKKIKQIENELATYKLSCWANDGDNSSEFLGKLDDIIKN